MCFINVCVCVCAWGECVCVVCVVHCCASKHITIACVQSQHLFTHVAQVQLHIASVVVAAASTSDPQHFFLRNAVLLLCGVNHDCADAL